MQVEILVPFQNSPDGHRLEWLRAGDVIEVTDSNAACLIRQGKVREAKREKPGTKKQYA